MATDMFPAIPVFTKLTAVIVIPSWMVIPLIAFGFISIIVIVLWIITKFSVNSKKLNEAETLTETGNLSAAVDLYKEVIRSSVATVEFKILPTDKSVFEKAVAGIEVAYEAAGESVNLKPIASVHAKWLKLQRQQRKSAVTDYSDEMKAVRKKAVSIADRLPEI
jgi:hypothetical protein